MVVLQAVAVSGAVRLRVRDSSRLKENLTILVNGLRLTGETVAQGKVSATGGAAELHAGDDLIIPAGTAVVSDTSILITADEVSPNFDAGVGAIITIDGTADAPTVAIEGGADLDHIQISNPAGINAGGTTTLRGGAADDRFFVRAVPGTMIVNGEGGADRYYLSSNSTRDVFVTGGIFNDSIADLSLLLTGTLETFTASLTVNTGTGGNGGTRDEIYASADGSSTALTGGKLQSASLAGLGNTSPISFTTTDGTSVLVRLSEHNDTFQVHDVAANVVAFVKGGGGDDILNVANSSDRINNISGIVVFDGDGGLDTLNVRGDGSTDPGELTAIGVTGLEMGDKQPAEHSPGIWRAARNAACVDNTSCPGAIYYANRNGATTFDSTVETVNLISWRRQRPIGDRQCFLKRDDQCPRWRWRRRV